ncbi:glycine N-acyltransferase-like [Ptychodera flava]|uniref:glycine N-acyltransferase-like n=1 Tax=Ptychodera flava TaxID=63121 RepID=UPI00396A398B
MAFKLTTHQIPELMEILEKWIPESLQMYYLVKNSYKRNNEWPHIDVYVDTTDLEQLSSVLAVWFLNSQCTEKSYNFHTTDAQKLKSLMKITDAIDVENDEISSFHCENMAVDVVANFLKDEKCLKPMAIGPFYTFILDNIELVDQTARRVIPKKFSIAPLKVKHASYLYDMWSNMYGKLHAIESFEKAITHQPTLAIYNEKDEPVSWAVVREWGDIGSTYTLPDYRRRGFASILTAKLTQLLLESGEIPHIKIDRRNTASVTLHTKIGFKDVNNEMTKFKL